MVGLFLAYAAWLVFWSYANANLFRHEGVIMHWVNGLMFIVSAAFLGWRFHWLLAPIILLETSIVFNISLNLWRRLDWDYVSPDPRSWVDQREKAVFGEDGATPKIIYALLLAVLLFIFYKTRS